MAISEWSEGEEGPESIGDDALEFYEAICELIEKGQVILPNAMVGDQPIRLFSYFQGGACCLNWPALQQKVVELIQAGQREIKLDIPGELALMIAKHSGSRNLRNLDQFYEENIVIELPAFLELWHQINCEISMQVMPDKNIADFPPAYKFVLRVTEASC